VVVSRDDAVITLDDFLRERFGATSTEPPADALEPMVRLLARETFLRRWLPPQIVRRLDAGFARSNTVHPDTARALFAIVCAARPAIVFETGTYWGFSTSILAAAVRAAQGTAVHTFDLYPKAGAHIAAAVRPWVVVHRGQPSVDSMPPVLATLTPDVFFQDSRHDYEGVSDELAIVAPHMRPTGVILFHDWVDAQVRRAAVDHLPGWELARIAGDDPQQLGVAWRPDRTSIT
jgi:predicted O-methyltransferase YrrM